MAALPETWVQIPVGTGPHSIANQLCPLNTHMVQGVFFCHDVWHTCPMQILPDGTAQRTNPDGTVERFWWHDYPPDENGHGYGCWTRISDWEAERPLISSIEAFALAIAPKRGM